jgi:hypothetical protein
MNTCSNFPLTQIWNSLSDWLVIPSRQIYTYQDWIGEPDEAIAGYDASELPATNPLPELDSDDFESEYAWFLS